MTNVEVEDGGQGVAEIELSSRPHDFVVRADKMSIVQWQRPVYLFEREGKVVAELHTGGKGEPDTVKVSNEFGSGFMRVSKKAFDLDKIKDIVDVERSDRDE